MSQKKLFELTQAGLDALKLELEDLKDVKRKENLEALKEAREQGDLSENADYDAARNEQARIEARILEIETIIKNVKIIKESNDSSAVNLGKEVTIKYLGIGRDLEDTYHIVGTIESDPKNKKVSIDSPLGKSIKGRTVGDVVTVKSETGKTFQVEILSIK
ncbi:transcription elongation factor GreA [Acholeplasma hippikon]|uniref:Transcription elongation factor GreA n=1 Tax=Acholeplasma hippikon TaxID=264636 RepID=A0A449BJE7_9MOLU|nr:transcription elongation factor GreA [Acholeplasma hippikon]VEU82591.1 transcription elongation factor GreA [Acholeplasma hippikon]